MVTKTKLPKSPRKDLLFNIRITAEDRAELQRLAEAEGLTVSAYFRKHLLRESGSVDRPKAKA